MARKQLPELTNLFNFYERFPNEEACRAYLVQERWNGVPKCLKCNATEKIYTLADGKRYKCGNCKHIFTVTVGTIFEASKISLHKWFLALYILSAHKKGISSLQLHRDLGVTQKTAWFMLHRIRYMLGNGTSEVLTGTVEADETYYGAPKHGKRGRGAAGKTVVFGMAERNESGAKVKAEVVEKAGAEITGIIRRDVEVGSTVHTDEYRVYRTINTEYTHETVNHSEGEYVRGEIHVNTIEGFWSLMKRGIYGTYHTVSGKHLDAYTDEFEYRYNTRELKDAQRFQHVFTQCEGRLKYNDLIEA